MKRSFRAGIFLSIFLPCIATAQEAVHAQNEPGKLIKDATAASYVASFKAMPAAKASSFGRTVNGILNEVYQMKILNPPTGFDVKTGLFAGHGQLQRKEPYARAFCFFRYKEMRNGTMKTSLDGSDLFFELNDFDFDQIGNFGDECYKLKFPLFFEQIPMTDSTDDYIELNFKDYSFPYTSNNVTGSPIRIIKANNRPLLIPLTRKEFVRFLVARGKRRIKENDDLIVDEKKHIVETKESLENHTLTNETKKILQDAIPSMEADIKKLGKDNQELQATVAHLNSVIDNMSPAEAAAPARLDRNKSPYDNLGLEQLVPAGRREGVMLTKLNPDYYDHSPDAPAVQLITVYYTWPDGFHRGGRDYLQNATVEVFNNLDYHKLKASMK